MIEMNVLVVSDFLHTAEIASKPQLLMELKRFLCLMIFMTYLKVYLPRHSKILDSDPQ